MGGQWLAEEPHRKENSGLSSGGSEGADEKAKRHRNAGLVKMLSLDLLGPEEMSLLDHDLGCHQWG